MEPLLSRNQRKTKERILSFLLVFLILLVPLSLLTNRSPDVEITGLTSRPLNLTTEMLIFSLKSNVNENLNCKVVVDYYKGGRIFDKTIQEVGEVQAFGTRPGELVLNAPRGKNTWVISSECFPVQ
jgi:hypothetical protein